MPFTPTHLIAVVPLGRLFPKVPFSAFAIGAMVPDLPLFLPLLDYAQFHSILGVFSSCLSTGLCCYFIWELLLCTAVVALLPAVIQQRIEIHQITEHSLSVRLFLTIAICIVAGASTHVFWDSFTHAGRWGVEQLPFLNRKLEMLPSPLPGYKALQYGSTIFFLPLLCWLSLQRLRATVPDHSRVVFLPARWKLGVWVAIVCIPIVVAMIYWSQELTAHQILFYCCVRSALAGLFILLTHAIAFLCWTHRSSSRRKD